MGYIPYCYLGTAILSAPTLKFIPLFFVTTRLKYRVTLK